MHKETQSTERKQRMMFCVSCALTEFFGVNFPFKGIVHPKMKILSSFTHPQLVPNLYECLCSAEHKGRYSEECGNRAVLGHHWLFFFPNMEVNGAPKQPGYKLSSKYLPLCSAEQRHSYRFGTTWGWVNDDRILIFGWTIPLNLCCLFHFCFMLATGIYSNSHSNN